MARPKEFSPLYVIGAAQRYQKQKEILDIVSREEAKTARIEKAVKEHEARKNGSSYKRQMPGQRAEVRFLDFGNTNIEIRGSTIRLTGYVNVTARDSRPIPSARGSFIEQVTPGTFKKALSANQNVEMRFNHGRKLCDQKSGLTLREDTIGLYADATFKDAEVARKARNNQLKGWSFGFSAVKDRWNRARDRRYLDEIRLLEVSILDRAPAYKVTPSVINAKKH